jgi:hypothetical protein
LEATRPTGSLLSKGFTNPQSSARIARFRVGAYGFNK